MARNKALIADLFSSALGLVFSGIAIVTPGFFIIQNQRMSIFYVNYKESGSDSWSTKTYQAYDEEHYTNGSTQLSMLDVQLESLLTLVLGGVGWLILLSNSRKTAPIPLRCLTGGIFLLVAATTEFAVLVRFIAVNASHIALVSKFEKSYGSLELLNVEVPYSLILAGFGITLILVALVRIFIRNKRYQLTTAIHHQMSNDPRSYVKIDSQHLTDEDERCNTEVRV
ncbi:uncharacterized protein LOC134272250 isoform X1 [Saccostrea cucullata]|uniref:uncharacterized protein LOC134272250 isoform X1 n=1 Tax=Saccostrea cuccullata TaxID=36930 RepID=UPI002ECFDAEE